MSEEIEKYVLNAIGKMPEGNRESAMKLNEYLIANDIKPRTRLSYMSALKSFFPIVNKKNMKEVSRADVEKWVRVIKKKYRHNSVHLYRITIKKFFQWVYGMDEGYPDVVKWIKGKKEKTLPNDILTTEDILNLIGVAKNDRDRALVHVLYESAGRVSEVLGLKLKDVSLDKYGASILVKGKTGVRRIRLINSVPLIMRWLDNHPLRNNPKAPLWLVEGYESITNGALGPKALEFKLRGLAKRSGVNKKVNPHNFRHSRLTELAKLGYMETELRIIAGWEPNSNMPSIYVHISGADIDRKMLSKEGILNEEIKADEVLKPVKCPRCKKPNPAGSKFCAFCSLVLDSKTALEVDVVKEELSEMTRAEDQLVVKVELFEKLMGEMRDLRVELERLKAK
jgi:site-specific recombinase XerD